MRLGSRIRGGENRRLQIAPGDFEFNAAVRRVGQNEHRFSGRIATKIESHVAGRHVQVTLALLISHRVSQNRELAHRDPRLPRADRLGLGRWLGNAHGSPT